MAKKAPSQTDKEPLEGPKPASVEKKSAAGKKAHAKVSAPEAVATESSNAAKEPPQNNSVSNVFIEKQRLHLLELRDHLVDSMAGVAQDNLRSRVEGDSSAFGMHQGDAGSDAYDRDFALNLLSQEQDALYEIDEALQRIANGSYGICEMSGKPIPEARLEAIPFARLTVECQEKVEMELGRNGGRTYGRPTRSLFGLMDNPSGEAETVDTE
jgi:DnaK suppressor protein